MPRMFTASMLAERWLCQPAYVLKLVKSGALPAVSLGSRTFRVKEEDVIAFEECFGDSPTKKPCDVYIVKSGEYVKIGKAANPKKRISELQISHPTELEIVAILTECDGHKVETQLHKRFAGHRHKGEWFRLSGDLAAWVEAGCKVAGAHVVLTWFSKPENVNETGSCG